VPKLFFLLSGENPTLPAAEVKAILESEGYRYGNVVEMDQVLRLEAPLESVKIIPVRAAYTRVVAKEVMVSNATYADVAKAASSVDFSSVIGAGESFVVRIYRIKNYADTEINTMTLEVKLGEQILQQTPAANVNLKNPDKTLIGIITENKLVLGLKLTDITSKTFSERRPRKKPFFHPSAMPSKMARCMVNLAHAKAESILLDPFAGTGTTLIEATFIGCRTVGIDAQRHMIKGTKNNLEFFNISAEGLIWGDSRKIPLHKADAIVTDPPYGRSSSTLKSTTKQLVHEVLEACTPLLGVGQRICIALPISPDASGKVTRLSDEISAFMETTGFDVVESHTVYIHSTLTREIVVYEKHRTPQRTPTAQRQG